VIDDDGKNQVDENHHESCRYRFSDWQAEF
jgi:hypothetical protein